MPQRLKGNVRQGSSHWNYTVQYQGLAVVPLAELVGHLRTTGCKTVDLLVPEQLLELGKIAPDFTCSSCLYFDVDGKGALPFQASFNNLAYQPRTIENTRRLISVAADFGKCAGVTIFVGDEKVDITDPDKGKIDPDEGLRNCIAGIKAVVGEAEKRHIALYLELLNNLDRGHPMKGHPGYMGWSLDFCLAVIRGVGSAALKLLFDIYHVSLMEKESPQDLIRKLGKSTIGHVHTAQKAERHETFLDKDVDQRACMQALVDIGYEGSVIHEFLPTQPVLEGLTKAIEFCDI